MTLRDRLLPDSIVARMTLVLSIGVIVAQLLGGWLWTQQLAQDEQERINRVTENLGTRMGQTIEFFARLPREYRHIVLDQLRDMGGTRFFVSVNREFIDLDTLPTTRAMAQARDKIQTSLSNQLSSKPELNINFVQFNDLRVLSGQNRMVALPQRWKQFALLDPQDESPVVVVQLPVGSDEWLYLATVFPGGEALFGQRYLTGERLLNLTLITLTALLLTLWLVRWVVRPLRKLAAYADSLGRGQSYQYMDEQGTSELKSTIRAFNLMGQRIQKYLSDRERLFAAISHDLKTPLTRARLRAEMMDGDEREKIIGDLDALATRVQASLQMVKDGAIHENSQQVDLRALLKDALEAAQVAGLPASLNVPMQFTLEARPLSIERLFTNLVDNALHYARGVDIHGWIDEQEGAVVVQVLDRGPGISDANKELVFEPYYRGGHQKPNDVHVGLGLGIVKSIAQLHGGRVELKDREGGGLCVEVTLPMSQFVTD